MGPSASSTKAASKREKLPLAARRHPLMAEIERAMRHRCGFAMDGPLVIGVSGGPDSLSLLIACVAMRDRREVSCEFEPVAVHVNHHLREAAAEDAKHVQAICDQLGIACQVLDIAPGDLPGNVAANARRLRYEAIVNAARSRGASHVAVAHHAEDQLETVLAALCRGTGVDGLAGMRWTRPLDENVRLIRPLLGAAKADCVSLCDAAKVKWREDPTNQDVSFARARLRRDVLPVLEELWPGAAQRAGAAADVIAVAAKALEARLGSIFGDASSREWERVALSPHPAAILAAGLRRAAIHTGESNDELLQRQLIIAAQAIKDDERRPRAFAVGRETTVHVTARSVRIAAVAQASRPCE